MAPVSQCSCGGMLPLAPAPGAEVVCPWCGKKTAAVEAVCPEPGAEALAPQEPAPCGEEPPTPAVCRRPWLGKVIAVGMLLTTAALVGVGKVNAHEKKQRDRFRDLMTKGDELQDRGLYAEAAETYGQVMEKAGWGPTVRSDLRSVISSAGTAKANAELLAEMATIRDEGQAMIEAGKYAEAVPVYERLVAKEPQAARSRVAAFFQRAKDELAGARADAAQLEALAPVLEEVARAMAGVDLEAAQAAIRRARAGGADPDRLLDSVAEFLARLSPQEQTLVSAALFERMNADMGVWMRARRRDELAGYREFLEARPDSPFAPEADRRIVDLEVAGILRGKPGMLPPPTRVGGRMNRNYSVVNITNGTKHTLTVRFSGVDSFKLVFQPQEEGSVELLNGRYRVAATADSPRIKPFAGTNSFDGGDYVSRFYIKTIGSFSLPPINIPTIPTAFGGGRPSAPVFTPAPPKRLLPDWMKRVIEPVKPPALAGRSGTSSPRAASDPSPAPRPSRSASRQPKEDQGVIRLRCPDGRVITVDTLAP